ncbi:transporter substrate-binding domain-containing protein [Pseudomonas sp. S75]|uniref:transporter substrate-binding domain-containing protein n=1 Tax=unclassified Pseudomonas TaxID=196821 RepID=UPI001908E753|nr:MULTISPECIES: transporter substrate-binding domain-containing protein [unclassified Pseudomonas]MBJ9977749.1 transporter substrate-binding domain-containing protein [Pseudomonas sp. S30]MBK0155316.1 transporter substrate-binding domain-containing protein [Pseudomonas sp. S75]
MKALLLPLLACTLPLAAHAADIAAVSPSRLDSVLESGQLRVCMTGDYKPFSYYRADQTFEGIDVDLARSLATSLGVKPVFVKTTWPTLLDDFSRQCDVALGGISITTERLKRVAFAESHLVDGKAPIIRCADQGRFPDFAAIDQPGTRAIVNPGGTNERFARSHYQHAQLTLHPDNVSIFQEIVDGRADVMVTDASETRWQARLHPELCPVKPDQPLQYAQKAIMLPRGDVPFKAYVDGWLNLAKANGEFGQIMDRWLKQ